MVRSRRFLIVSVIAAMAAGLSGKASSDGWHIYTPVQIVDAYPASGKVYCKPEIVQFRLYLRDQDRWLNTRPLNQEYDELETRYDAELATRAIVTITKPDNDEYSIQPTFAYHGQGMYTMEYTTETGGANWILGTYKVKVSVDDVPVNADDPRLVVQPGTEYTFILTAAPTPTPTPVSMYASTAPGYYTYPFCPGCASTRWVGDQYVTEWGTKVDFNLQNINASKPQAQNATITEIGREWELHVRPDAAVFTPYNTPGVGDNFICILQSPGVWKARARIQWEVDPYDGDTWSVWSDWAESPPITVYQVKIDGIWHGSTRIDTASDGIISPLPYGADKSWNDWLRVRVSMDPVPSHWGTTSAAQSFVTLLDIDHPDLDSNDNAPIDHDADEVAPEINRSQSTAYAADSTGWWEGEGRDNHSLGDRTSYLLFNPRLTQLEHLFQISRRPGDNYVAVTGAHGASVQSKYLHPDSNPAPFTGQSYADHSSREITIVEPIDLDVDSDNSSLEYDFPPDRTADEDSMEEEAPGRILFANRDDDDGDGVPDHLDGGNLNGVPGDEDDVNEQEDDFFKMVLQVAYKVSLDPDSRIRFRYNEPPFENHLRVWNKPGHLPRTPLSMSATDPQTGERGNLVLPGAWYKASRIFQSLPHSQMVDLWVESVIPEESHSPEMIRVEYDVEGDGTADYWDIIKISPPRYVNLTIDSNNDGLIDGTDDLIEEARPGRIVLIDQDEYGEPFAQYCAAPLSLQIDDELVWNSQHSWNLRFPPLVRVYRDANRTSEVVSDETNQDYPPSLLYVEGVDVSSASGDVLIELHLRQDGRIVGYDRVRATSFNFMLDLPVSEAGYHDVYVGALFPPFEPGGLLLGEEPQGAVSFDVDVKSGESTTQDFKLTEIVEHQGCGFRFETTTVAGSVYAVTAEFLGTKDIKEFPVVAGMPAYALLGSPFPESLPADMKSLGEVSAEIFDAYGNPVEEDTPASWRYGNACTLLTDTTETEVSANGEIRAEYQVDFSVTDKVVEVHSMGAVASVAVPVEPISGDLKVFVGGVLEYVQVGGNGWMGVAPYPEVDLAQNETWRVRIENLNVPDGTEVFWYFSNGFADRDAGPAAKPGLGKSASTSEDVILTWVDNGVAQFEYTPDLSHPNTRVGPNFVVSSIGMTTFTTRLNYVYSGDFYLEIDRGSDWKRTYLARDVTTDGTLSSTVPSPWIPTIEGMDPSLDLPPRSLAGQYYAGCSLSIVGPPGIYRVRKSEFNASSLDNNTYFQLTDEDGLPLDEDPYSDDYLVEIPSGSDAFVIRVESLGLMDETSAEVLEGVLDNSRVEILVTQDFGDYEFRKETICGTDKKRSGWLEQTGYILKDIGLGLVGWDTETAAGCVASVVGGLIVIGDVGAIAKNIYYMIDGDDETNASLLETTLSVVGLIPFGGDAVSGVAKVFRYGAEWLGFGKKAASVAIDAAKGGDEAARILPLMDDLAASPDYLKNVMKMPADGQVIEEGATLFAKSSPNFRSSFKRVHQNVITEFGPTIGARFQSILSKVSSEVLDTLDDDALNGLAKVLNRTDVDPSRMVNILNRGEEFWGGAAAYKQADLLKDLGEVADNVVDPHGLHSILGHLGARVQNIEPRHILFFQGRMAEARTAAVLSRRGISIAAMSKWTRVLVDPVTLKKLGKTDMAMSLP